jgi:hypothetical protein
MATKRSQSRAMIRVLAGIARDRAVPSYERLTAIAMLSWLDAGKPIRAALISNLLRKEPPDVAPVFAPVKPEKSSEPVDPSNARKSALARIRDQGY